MPSPINELVRRRVMEQWLNGEARDKIASDLQIVAGTVSNIVSEFKIGLENSEFDSIRQLALEIRKQQLNWSDLASHFRLYNHLIKSGASEEKVESFITNVSSNDIPSDKVIELVNQLYDISNTESIPLDQVPSYIERKLEEKQKVDQEIKAANDILQNKTVTMEAINEHLQLKNELDKHGISIQDTDKLKNLLSNAKENGFDPRLIVRKLRNIKRLENKENKLKASCEVLSKKEAKYKDVIPLANIIWDLHIGRSELISFKVAVNEAAEQYGFPASTAAFHVLNNIRDYNKIGGLKKELNNLLTQVFSINEIWFRQNKSMMAMLNLQSRGITEEQILHVNNFLEKNGYEIHN